MRVRFAPHFGQATLNDKYDEAAPLISRALTFYERSLGPDHPMVATVLNNRVECMKAQGLYEDASRLLERVIAMLEAALGPRHPKVAIALHSWAGLLEAQGKYDQAESLCRRALAIREQMLGSDHQDVAVSLNTLAALLETQERSEEAELMYSRAIEILATALGPHPNVAMVLLNLASLLSTQGKDAEADELLMRALEIQEYALGRDRDVSTSLYDLARWLAVQGKYERAEALCRRSLAIREKTVGAGDPKVAACLNSLAKWLTIQCKYEEAETLFQRAVAILEAQLGPDHADVAKVCVNLADLYRKQGRNNEAEHLSDRAAAVLLAKAKSGSKSVIPSERGVRQGRALKLNEMAGAPELHKAAYDGKMELVEQLLKSSRFHPDMQWTGGMSPLHYAVQQNLIEVVRVLLRRGANPNLQNSSGLTALHMAAAILSLEMVKLLLESGADPQVLDNRGLPPKGMVIQFADGTEPDEELVRLLTPRKDGSSGQEDGSASAKPKTRSDAGRKLHEMVGVGASKLTKAVLDGNLEFVEQLLKSSGVNLNLEIRWTGGMSPLHYAVKKGFVPVVGVLLRHGANPNLKTSSGWTALHMAAAKLSLEMVKLLLDSGADPQVLDNDGLPPKDWVIQFANGPEPDEELVRLLTPGKGGSTRQKEDFAIINPDPAAANRDRSAEIDNMNIPTVSTVSLTEGKDVRGYIYGSYVPTLGGRVLAMIAGRSGMSFNPPSDEKRTKEVYVTEAEGLDLVLALTSRSQDELYTSNVCGENVVSPLLSNDPLMMEIAAQRMTGGFTKDFSRRSFLARKVLRFEAGSREDLPLYDEGPLWSMLLASGKALGGSYHDLCMIALMDCARGKLKFVEAGVCAPTTGLLPVDLLLATLSALTTKAGGRRVSLSSRCYCSALLQRYACASLAPPHLEFQYTPGVTSMVKTAGVVNLFWTVADVVFKMPVSGTDSSALVHSLGPVMCDPGTSLPVLQGSPEIQSWEDHPLCVGARDVVPKLLDFFRFRKVVGKVVAAELAIFGEGARTLAEVMLPKDEAVTQVQTPDPNWTPPSTATTSLECPYTDPSDLAPRLGEGAEIAGWDATQRATWLIVNWDYLTKVKWTTAGLEAISLLLRFGTSCPAQVNYARTFGEKTAAAGVLAVLDNLDSEPWLQYLDKNEVTGLRGLVCLLVDAERASDVWGNRRIKQGRCYAPIASLQDCGNYTCLDSRGSPIVYGLRVLRGSDPTSVEYGKDICGFTYHSRLGLRSWNIKVNRSVVGTLHIKERPSSGAIIQGEASDWNYKVNGLIGLSAAL